MVFGSELVSEVRWFFGFLVWFLRGFVVWLVEVSLVVWLFYVVSQRFLVDLEQWSPSREYLSVFGK